MALYDAFVSYSHAKDKPIAAALQSRVQKLGKPWYKRRALRIFRDDTSLSATPHLWPSIEQALSQSRYFILLASPEAAASKWVAKEVAYWLEHKSVDTLLIGVTDGDVHWDDAVGNFDGPGTTALPAALFGRFVAEPKWVDLRKYRDGAKGAKFDELTADFAAAIRGLPKEDILSEELRRQRQALATAWSAAALLLVLGSGAAWQWKVAVDERNRAERTIRAATMTANLTLSRVAGGFENAVGVPSDTIKEIIILSLQLQSALVTWGEDNDELRKTEYDALRKTASVLHKQGAADAALEAAQRALEIAQRMSSLNPSDIFARHNIASSRQIIGDIMHTLGRDAEAIDNFAQARLVLEKIAADPATESSAQDIAIGNAALMYQKIGQIYMLQDGGMDKAADAFRAADDIAQRLLKGHPADIDARTRAASTRRDLAQVLLKSGKREEALKEFRSSTDIIRQVAAIYPTRSDLQGELYRSLLSDGNALGDLKRNDEALAAFTEAATIIERLVALDPGNAMLRFDLANVIAILGISGRDPKANFARALEIIRDLDAHKQLTEAQARRAKSIEDAAQKFADTLPVVVPGDTSDEILAQYEAIGDKFAATSRVDDALSNYRASIAARERRFANHPGDIDGILELVNLRDKVGSLLLRFNRTRDALPYFKSNVQLREKLVKADPDNLEWQLALARNLLQLGVSGGGDPRSDRRAVEIMRKLDEAGYLTAEQRSAIKVMEDALAK
jgi:tetratricopeptide (TPR) repeat protein